MPTSSEPVVPTVIPAQCGDVFVTRSYSLLGRAIRYFEKSRGESASMVNHTGLIVASNFGDPMIIEALSRVRLLSMVDGYGGSNVDVWVYRHRDMSEARALKARNYAFDHVGRSYGFLKLFAHLGDWTLTRLRFWSHRDVYLVRRLCNFHNYPICSWLVGYALESAGIYVNDSENNPIAPRILTPDDIWDDANWAGQDRYWTLVWSGKVTKRTEAK